MMAYSKVQKKVMELGIDVTDMDKDQMLQAVLEKEPDFGKVEEAPVVEPEYDIAIVRNKNGEVRRYSLADHGENFIELAKEYCKRPGHEYELTKAKELKICPHCGKVID